MPHINDVASAPRNSGKINQAINAGSPDPRKIDALGLNITVVEAKHKKALKTAGLKARIRFIRALLKHVLMCRNKLYQWCIYCAMKKMITAQCRNHTLKG